MKGGRQGKEKVGMVEGFEGVEARRRKIEGRVKYAEKMWRNYKGREKHNFSCYPYLAACYDL